jgi:uncharacterized protein YaaR (DUF327 family)
MASRKVLKKAIKGACGELFADCVALSMCKDANKEVLFALEGKLVDLCQDFVSRLSHTEKGNEKKFYKKLVAEFTDSINAIAEEIIKA